MKLYPTLTSSSTVCCLAPAFSNTCFWQDTGEESDIVNGVEEPSPGGSPGEARKVKPSQAATLPAKSQDSAPANQMEGYLHRKHEWEGHNKKASSRYTQIQMK